MRNRWPGLFGIAFAVLFVLGMLLLTNTPDYDAPDQEWTEWFDDGGNRAQQIIGLAALILAALAFIPFLVHVIRGLRSRYQTGDAPTIALVSGALFATLLVMGAVVTATGSLSVEIGDIPIPAPDVLRWAEQAGYGFVLGAGGWAASVAIGVISWTARRTALFPTWLTTAGWVAAVLLIASTLFIPIVVLPLWVLTVSVVLLRAPASAPITRTPPVARTTEG
ncbi:MAG TPA: hypothetical protein VM282_21005 [Acidimicrobiales bacterium]|nr:hypothetical protein [Acidimicrobiales bacterium]